MAGGRPAGGAALSAEPPRTATSSEAVTIESLAAGGEGVGHLSDGMAVFVPRTAIGDRVGLGRLRLHRRFARAEVARLLEGGPERVPPPCPHFTTDDCGGCQWQHLSIAAQGEAKRRIVGDALRRIAHLDAGDPDLVESPRSLGYRATITLTVQGQGPDRWAGFHRRDDPSRVFALDRCLIARDELNQLWAALRPGLGALPEGRDVRLSLRVADDGGLHVVVRGGSRARTDAGLLEGALRAAGIEATIWRKPPAGEAGGEGEGEGEGAEAPGALSFQQVNPEVAALLRQAVVAAAGSTPAQSRALGAPGPSAPPVRVLDLYAGVGEVGLALAPYRHGTGRAERGVEVTLVDADRGALRRAEERARRGGLRVCAVARRVEDVIAQLLPADVVVVNPPRGGLAPTVSGCLASRPPLRLIYVSCDPATLARDLARMRVGRPDAPAPRLTSVRCFDMFPQTSQVEVLAILDWSTAASP